MSKQETILKECLIEHFIEEKKKRKDKIFISLFIEEQLAIASEEVEEVLTDKDSEGFRRTIYSAMDKYHNSFLK